MRRILHFEQRLSRSVGFQESCATNVGGMGRREYHGRQFCSEYHPAKNIKAKEEEYEKRSYIRSEGLTTDSPKPRGFAKVVS